ncbi:SAV_915 family protein [Micromonospora sp. NPDC094482]|uniref:SAV_915 family protein n=1 Tax=unclassified Micromonospora TaxID=2617518 RepID=UPI0033185270
MMDEVPDTWVVPVREVPGRQAMTVRTARLPQGQRVGLAFTGPEKLVGAMGADQPWTRLCESALRAMLKPLGIDRIQLDPLLVAPPVAPEAPAGTPSAPLPRPPAGALAGTRQA